MTLQTIIKRETENGGVHRNDNNKATSALQQRKVVFNQEASEPILDPSPLIAAKDLRLTLSNAEAVEDEQDDFIQICEENGDSPATCNTCDASPQVAPKFSLSIVGISVEDNDASSIICEDDIASTSKAITSGPKGETELEKKTHAKFSKGALLGVEPPVLLKRASYEVNNEGTLVTDLFHIGKSGFSSASHRSLNTNVSHEDRIFPTTSASTNKSIQLQISEDTLLELSLLGRGAGGKVLKALHTPSMTLLALKCIDVSDKTKRAQLLKELKELDSSYSPHIVAFYGAYYVDSTFNVKLGLEYMNRGSLQSIMHEFGALPELALTNCVKQVLTGLKHLHSNKKLHRDIKPGNILVNHLGMTKLSDFGILAELASSMAKCGTFVGTMVYMSPERLTSEAYSYPADIWSLGLSVIALAMGSYPLNIDDGYWGLVMHFNTKPSPSLPIDKDFSSSFHDFIAHCMAKEPAKRWTADELLQHPWIVNGCELEEAVAYWPGRARMFEPNPVIVTKQKSERLTRIRKYEELELRRKLKVTIKEPPACSQSNGNVHILRQDIKDQHQHRRRQAITRFHPVGLAYLQAEANQHAIAIATKSKLSSSETDLYGSGDDDDERTVETTTIRCKEASQMHSKQQVLNTATSPVLSAQYHCKTTLISHRSHESYITSTGPQSQAAEFSLISPTRANRQAQLKIVNGKFSLSSPGHRSIPSLPFLDLTAHKTSVIPPPLANFVGNEGEELIIRKDHVLTTHDLSGPQAPAVSRPGIRLPRRSISSLLTQQSSFSVNSALNQQVSLQPGSATSHLTTGQKHVRLPSLGIIPNLMDSSGMLTESGNSLTSKGPSIVHSSLSASSLSSSHSQADELNVPAPCELLSLSQPERNDLNRIVQFVFECSLKQPKMPSESEPIITQNGNSKAHSRITEVSLISGVDISVMLERIAQQSGWRTSLLLTEFNKVKSRLLHATSIDPTH